MARPRSVGPTPKELAILQVLWDKGPSTVRQIHQAISRKSGTGYTTTLKLLQVMFDKELVVRDESEQSHVYRPRISQERTQRQMVRDLLDRAFRGSARQLVMHALSAKQASAKELAEIRKLLNELEGDQS